MGVKCWGQCETAANAAEAEPCSWTVTGARRSPCVQARLKGVCFSETKQVERCDHTVPNESSAFCWSLAWRSFPWALAFPLKKKKNTKKTPTKNKVNTELQFPLKYKGGLWHHGDGLAGFCSVLWFRGHSIILNQLTVFREVYWGETLEFLMIFWNSSKLCLWENEK